MSQTKNETQEKIQKLSMMEQSLQSFLAQKQQFQSQLVEIESALEELDKTEKAYKIVGNIMIAGKKEEIKTDLEKKKEALDIRIKNIEKQEEKIREKTSEIQSEVLKKIN